MFRGVKTPIPTYLSIDIDFFGYPFLASLEEFELFLEDVAKFSSDNDILIQAMMNHHQMLRCVNQSHARRLVNLDAHSDLANKDVDELNIGTWISYVKWRKQGQYIWLRNASDPYGGECGYSFTYPHARHTDWSSVTTHHIDYVPTLRDLNKMSVVEIGMCMSPDFCEKDHEMSFVHWLKENKIQYRKGYRDEHKSYRAISPPKR